MFDNEFYGYLFYLIFAINIVLFADILIQINKIIFIRKNLGNLFQSIPKINRKINFTDVFIILIWVAFASYKIYTVATNPVGFFGNLDYLLIIFAFLALSDRIVGMYISNGFGTPSITFFHSENGIIIYNPLRKVTQFNILKFYKWDEIAEIDSSIQDIQRRIWKFSFKFQDESTIFVIFENNQKEIFKTIIAERKIKLKELI